MSDEIEKAVRLSYGYVIDEARATLARLEGAMDNALAASVEVMRLESELRRLLQYVEATKVLLDGKLARMTRDDAAKILPPSEPK